MYMRISHVFSFSWLQQRVIQTLRAFPYFWIDLEIPLLGGGRIEALPSMQIIGRDLLKRIHQLHSLHKWCFSPRVTFDMVRGWEHVVTSLGVIRERRKAQKEILVTDNPDNDLLDCVPAGLGIWNLHISRHLCKNRHVCTAPSHEPGKERDVEKSTWCVCTLPWETCRFPECVTLQNMRQHRKTKQCVTYFPIHLFVIDS